MNSVRVGEEGLREWQVGRESNVSKRKKRQEQELTDAAQSNQGKPVESRWVTLRGASWADARLLHRA